MSDATMNSAVNVSSEELLKATRAILTVGDLTQLTNKIVR
jgi:hypothetical protein